MDAFLLAAIFAISLLINLSSFDDLFIDIIAFAIVRHEGPNNGNVVIPTTAVFVANWHEENILGRMVEGNLARIPNSEVKFFLGVYPNDSGTLRVAIELAERHPDRVRVIVNTLPGPTSKGQMLNEMFRQVFERDNCPELVVLHDSEDIIDPRTFRVYAAYASEWDFIQVPVFSLNSVNRSRVAASYMDEFAERHTREMIVRNAVGAMIPSAGVGTCITKRLLKYFLNERGQVLMSGTVTEDYILGVEAKRAGFKSVFAAMSAEAGEGLDYVATREFFPKTTAASIKQKTRWVYGINFEAMHKLGWNGDWWDRYFFLRDRKGMITNLLPPISLVLLLGFVLGVIELSEMPPDLGPLLSVSMRINLAALLVRYVIRVTACRQVYGRYEWIGIAIRWPLSLYINMVATWQAWATYVGKSEFASKPIVWSKTTHELPEDFASATR
jgi:adsorption protein B